MIELFWPFKRSWMRPFCFWPLIIYSNDAKHSATIYQLEQMHEEIHYNRQAWWSPVWVLWYFLSKRFRWQEERLAFTPQIIFENDIYGKDEIMRLYPVLLSSRNYWHMCSRNAAIEFVEDILDECD